MTVLTATALLLAAGSFQTRGRKQTFVYDEPEKEAIPLAYPVGLLARPIHFASGSYGELTNRIVIGVDDARALGPLRALPGFLSDAPLAFHEHTRTALFRAPEVALAAAN